MAFLRFYACENWFLVPKGWQSAVHHSVRFISVTVPIKDPALEMSHQL